MKQLVRVNLTTRTAKDWTPAEIVFGESLTLSLRFLKNTEGEEIETTVTVDSLMASVGLADARPRGGRFAIKVGNGPISDTNTTDLMDSSVRASEMTERLNAVEATATYGDARVVFLNGSWWMFFGEQDQQVPLEVVHNGLWPVSFGRISARSIDGKWTHRLRLTQAPVAFTTALDVVLPPAPKITRLQEGGTDGGFKWNEIQELYIPREFRGAFVLKKGFARTTKLSKDESPDTIKAALQALGANCFDVTLPLSQRPAIEFIGDYAGSSHPLLVSQVVQAPAGDLTFTIKFDRDELAVALQSLPDGDTLELPLEIRIVGTDDSGFSDELVALFLPVVIRKPVGFPELELRPTIDWLRPASPVTYVPFGANQVLTGNKARSRVVGDGENNVFTLTTGLAGELIYVFVRENFSGGRLLVNGTDFAATIDSDNEVTVTALGDPPPVDGWVITAAAAEAIAEWANGLTVTVPQVIGGDGYPALPDFMDNINERLETIEEILIPGVPPPVADTSTVGFVSVIPEISEILFYDKRMSVGEVADVKTLFGEKGLDVEKLLPKRAPLMLPAVHDGTLTDPLPTPLPAAAAGTVWVADGRTLIPGGGGIRSSYIEDDGFVASDGRLLYPSSRSGESNSYYPRAFERTLFEFAVNEEMLAVKRTLEILFGVQTQLVHASCKARWVLSMQLGEFTSDTTPSPVGLNLAEVEWSDPVFERVIDLTSLAQSHFFGLRILRTALGFNLDQNKYGNWTPNNAAIPTSPNFAVRGVLDRFDTENTADPRGYVAWKLIGSISVDDAGKQTTSPAKIRIY